MISVRISTADENVPKSTERAREKTELVGAYPNHAERERGRQFTSSQAVVRKKETRRVESRRRAVTGKDEVSWEARAVRTRNHTADSQLHRLS